ncbi:MAG TPA: PilZ domain-containing protein [Nitrospira sp.]|nr:PilZ domain-containing protein [Nitrospira sp.]
MTFPVVSTAEHQGKSLVVDAGKETINVHDISGQFLGCMSWGAIIERVLVNGEDARFAHCRTQPRAPLALKIRYTTPEGKQFDSLTGGIGGGGLFIESGAPLSPGTELTVEFALPDRPWDKLKAKAKVAWVRNKPERYLLFPGMGIQFVELDKNVQEQLVGLVEALNRSRNPA